MSLQLVRDPERALNVYSRAVLGVNPDEIGSPWAAAFSSLGMFAVGALVPLLPWFLTLGISAVALSLLLAGAAAVTIGAVLGYPNGRRMFYSALRQLLVTALATAVTFFVGRLFGAPVS